MAIHVTCVCGKKSRVPDEFVGRRVKCPACGQAIAPATAPANPEGKNDPETPQQRRVHRKFVVGMTLLTILLSVGVPVLIVGPKTKAKEFDQLLEELTPSALTGLAGGGMALVGGLGIGRLVARWNLDYLTVAGTFGVAVGGLVLYQAARAKVDGYVVLGILAFFLGMAWVFIGTGAKYKLPAKPLTDSSVAD